MKEMFERFPILNERRHQKASTLSGGEQEILAIARALMIKPELLILDEPSWGLAPLMIEEVMRIIVDIKENSGTTILLVEQNAAIALKFADHAFLIDNGKVVLEGTGKELLANPRVQEVYLGG
jgi:branched-chain amino acid transport system ATP-binding protein